MTSLSLYRRIRRAAANHDRWLKLCLNVAVRPLLAGMGVIFGLHRVCPVGSGARIPFAKNLEISPELLERTILILKKRNYDLVSFDEMLARLRNPKGQRRFAVFALDDGYADNLTHGLAVFTRYEVPFTVFVTNCFPNHSALLWWYLLEDLVLKDEHLSFESEGRELTMECATFEEKCEAYSYLTSHFIFASRMEQQRRLVAVLGDKGVDLIAPVRQMALSWNQVRELAQHPLATVGAHSMNHLALACLPAQEATAEMAVSKAQIEAEINCPVRHFAYPYGGRGAAGNREFEMAEGCGFASAVTTRTGNLFTGHRQHVYSLPRLALTADIVSGDMPQLPVWLDGLGSFHVNHGRRFVTE